MLANNSTLLDADDPLLTPKDSVADLNSFGLKISTSWFEKLCAANEGPPIDCYWGRRPMRKRSTLRKWAEERMRAAQKQAA